MREGAEFGQGIHRCDRVELRRHHSELLDVGEWQEDRPAGLALPRWPEDASRVGAVRFDQ